MKDTYTIMAITGLLLINGVWIAYLASIPAEKVPRRPLIHVILLVVGLVLALVGVIRPILSGDPFPILPLILGVFSAGLVGLFIFLLAIATLPDTKPAVSVGDTLPSFSALNDTGETVDTAGWRGRRILLKFFRGHW